ncbi:hypothetical protein RHGRI_035035 [Rhododendron griersonianum]|uniref:Splicing factor Cactin C-terminal domain-containing protein n=1 Tax=Rhododendron griersonianum TaxID=479676 RepID=A0AAV6I5U2_9ERIC|nr:hypothetical protein RHGRI_035035 [Rhododendron griersonianum]
MPKIIVHKTHFSNTIEKACREEERALLARECAWAEFQDWESKEEESDSDRRRSRSEADNLDKAMGATEEGGAVFGGSSDEVNIDSPVYLWRDEYCPRKPKYSNRVHTGYEWNKYNRTHYDHDNPPPKAVQGYKFNIFYPDLADKTKACPQKLLLMLYREILAS